MKKLAFVFLFCSNAFADVTWDIPIEEYGRLSDTRYLRSLAVGEVAKIDEYAVFCTTDNGDLAISGLSETGEGDYLITRLSNGKVEFSVPDAASFVKELIIGQSFSPCTWWTADRGKYSLVIDNINGKTSLTDLIKNNRHPDRQYIEEGETQH